MNKNKNLEDILEDLKTIEKRLTSLEKDNNIEGIVNSQVAKILELTLDAKVDRKINEKLKEKEDAAMQENPYSTRSNPSHNDGKEHRGGERDENHGAMQVYDDELSYDDSLQQTDIEKQTSRNRGSKKSNLSFSLKGSMMLGLKNSKDFFNPHKSSTNFEEESVISPDEAEGNLSSFETRLYRDSYALMTVSYPFATRSWWFGTLIFLLQLVLLIIIINEQDVTGEPLFNAPIYTTVTVSIAQFFAIIVTLFMSTDIIEATKSIHLLLMGAFYEENRSDLLDSTFGIKSVSYREQKVPKSITESHRIYRIMVLLPNFLKFIEGFLALFTSFIIIVQSTNVIDLFEDFLALQVVSNIDDITFWLCLQGYFGKLLQRKSDEVTKITLKDFTQVEEPTTKVLKTKFVLPSFHALISVFVYFAMVTGWAFVLYGQETGKFYDSKYPHCQVKLQGGDFRNIGNGKCDGGLFNRYECDFDGGDCISFRLAYPDCLGPEVDPAKISDGKCDPKNNYKECGYDGGDCCSYIGDDPDITGLANKVFKNGICNPTKEINTEQCKFDNGECAEHNRLYPGCFVQDASKIGDKICDGGDAMTPECNWDGDDCKDCEIVIGANLSFVGDNICNGGIYFTDECGGNDGGDCDACIEIVGKENKSKIGDGICHLGKYLNEACSHDGLDCLWKMLGEDLYGELNFDKFGVSTSINELGNIIAVGGHTNDGNGDNSGHVKVFEYVNDKWIQMGYDIDGESGGDESGYSISLSSDGQRIAIGARKNNGDGNQRGHVRVYEFVNNTSWLPIGKDIDGENDKDYFGFSVSLSSNGLIVAASAGKNGGYVEVYEYDGSSWNKIGTRMEGKTIADRFGYVLSLSQSKGQLRLAISAPFYDSQEANDVGYVEVYELTNGSWTPLGDFIVGERQGDTFGNAISLSADGNRLAIGGEQFDGREGINSGYVRVFDYNDSGGSQTHNESGGNWKQIGVLEGERMSDYFGHSVSLSEDGSILAVGAFYNDGTGDNAGHVRIFAYVDNSWKKVGEDIDGLNAGDEFGSSVSLNKDGRRVVIGGRLNGYVGKSAGHVRVYYIE